GECASGFCVSHMGERLCTRACVDDCPDGWLCRDVQGIGGDVTFICVSRTWSLCLPCRDNHDCENLQGQFDHCVVYGGQGRFCGASCGRDEDCPDGHACLEALTVSGWTGLQCMAEAGTCPCSPAGIQRGVPTVCGVSNEWGTCSAERWCTADGLTPCTAATPAPEVCDRADNDCDGTPDDGLPGCCACGNGTCEPQCGEFETCLVDCTIVCGNGKCEITESPLACPEDCCRSAGGAGCGDGACLGFGCGESPATCPADCGTACGNAACDKGESPQSCAADCDWTWCGNGVCDFDEAGPDGCLADCEPACGDCDCEGTEGWLACPVDCGYCGDGVCSPCPSRYESADTCPRDCAPGAEVCNREDDDGDGWTDEEDAAGCLPYRLDSDGDGHGVAAHRCLCGPDGAWRAADDEDCDDDDAAVHPGAVEACNGRDDDCDGVEDEGFPLLETPCDGADDDSCARGKYACSADGTGVECPSETVTGIVEAGNGKDDDCDGLEDEDFPLLGAPCDGPDDDGCANGKYVCGPGGTGVACGGETVPAVEACNGKDDDCGGLEDEDFPLGAPCDGPDDDLCPNGGYVCSADGTGVDCPSETVTSVPEICNGLDDDCDGPADEDFPLLGAPCDGPDDDLCLNGQYACSADGKGVECPSETATSIPETCNGLDDDCDGPADEDFPLGAPCDGPDDDNCSNGQYVCSADGTGVECPSEAVTSIPETCNGLDDDCDGPADEDFPLGAPCDGPDDDLCPNGGYVCSADGTGVECASETVASIPETCNGLDDDCDGGFDEGLAGCPTTDHAGADWVASAATVSGRHVNIGAFGVPAGVTLTVLAFDGTGGGWLHVRARTVSVAGTIDASGKGYGGGGGGGGGAGSAGGGCPETNCGCAAYASGGPGGAGAGGGAAGTAGCNVMDKRAEGGAGGAGGGPHGGAATTRNACTGKSSAGVAGAGGPDGGYAASGANGDTSTDATVGMGSGGAGGGGGSGACWETLYNGAGGGGGGGAGGRGGGAVTLEAAEGTLAVTGSILTTGRAAAGSGTPGGFSCASWSCDWGGNGGSGGTTNGPGGREGGTGGCAGCTGTKQCSGSTSRCYFGGNGGTGGTGAGGGVLLSAPSIDVSGTIDAHGGAGATNGGTVKVLGRDPGTVTGTIRSGRTYVVP
ncbi:MAG: hypothetical protein FJ087_19505, partial [Deltaproteobacteria bacterium]|nr:hypothetical protein [Deltaproteobacteria bacterium]